jgi:hypothetical protein
MKSWIVAAALAAACASAEPAARTASDSPAPAASSANYADARSSASDDEVRDARRAYRAACQTQHAEAYCECMTGGMAQALPPAELAVATAAFSGQDAPASQEVRDRVAAMRAEIDRGCAQFRG